MDDKSSTKTTENLSSNVYNQKINALIEKIFLITLNKQTQRNKQLIYIEELASVNETQSNSTANELLNIETLEQALFERLLLQTPSDFLIPNNIKSNNIENICETRTFIYLYQSYQRIKENSAENDTIQRDACEKMCELILRNASTAIKQPDLFVDQQFTDQWSLILSYNDNVDAVSWFLSNIVKEVLSDNDPADWEALTKFFHPVFQGILKKIQLSSMDTLDLQVIPSLMYFVSDRQNLRLAELLLDFTTPPATKTDGIHYSNSLLGQLLSLAILPKKQNGQYEYYQDFAKDAQSSSYTQSLWMSWKMHLDKLHSLFKAFLLMGGTVRHKILQWIGNCLHANVKRGQIAASMAMFRSVKTSPDSFMINLANILLRLCQPLVRPQLKVMMVDPSYCAVSAANRLERNVHMIDCDKETCLVPPPDDTPVVVDDNNDDTTTATASSSDAATAATTRLTANTYNFITEIFFMAHKAIDLGYRVCIEKCFQMNRDFQRMQGAIQDAAAQGGSDVSQNLMQMLNTQMPNMLCLENSLIEPTNDMILLQFYEASSIWLSQLAARDEMKTILNAEKGFAPMAYHDLELPLTNPIPSVLRSIPEYVLENIVGYLTFIKHFPAQSINTDPDAQKSMLTMIMIFMGSSDRVRNPHLRARLAEGLESMLPKKDGGRGFSESWKATLFATHPHRLEIIPNLLRVFVGIEVTGQSVQFEQKFNYRRPMYIIMEYLWNHDEQKESFKRLAREAEANMEAVDPPIFLRFINLLINDAIYLLDELLTNLQSISRMQHALDNGEWEQLPEQERQQNMGNMQQIGMFARFDSILGRDTINILKLLTSEIDGIFCHASIVDRMAAMLNYFLLHLVGPSKKNLVVCMPLFLFFLNKN